ncbi:MAG: Ig-like domain-containing protein [Chitinophagaceae bacterium]
MNRFLLFFRSIFLRERGGYTVIFNKWFIPLLLVFFVAGCKKVVEESGTTGICPIVVSTDPANGAINVVTGKIITATFNEAIDPLTINATTFLLRQGTNTIAGTITYAGLTATFTPASPLAANTVYTGTITTGVRDPANNAMIADYVWSFNTGAVPIVVSTDPANGAADVAIGKVITATFSTTMNPATISGATYVLRQGATIVPGVVTYSGMTASFTPASPLTPGTVYTGTITTGATDVSGNALAANYTWTFATGALPTVISTDPANAATNVAAGKVITATFSTAMNPATITGTTFLLKQGTTSIAGVVTYSGTTASFTPSAALTANTVYTATITTGARNVAGNPLAADYVWSFTTGSVPAVVSTDPANLATNVLPSKIITATFNMAMDPLTINSATFVLKQGATSVLGVITYSGTTATFTPAAPLAANTVYTGTITTGAKNPAGNPLVADYVWTFTTGAIPTVTSTDPANGAVNVPLNKIITATFSMAMDPATINATTFSLRQGATVIAGVVTYSGTTATFTPGAPLASNTIYTATITTGAKNVAGNALAANYVWSFTTMLPVPTNLLASAAMFGAFGGSAGITNQGINTVINNGGIGTTGASTLITGFHDGLTAAVYTETPLNIGLVTGGIYTAPPPPGTAASFAIATQGFLDATIAYNSISPASRPGGTDPGAGQLGGLTLPAGVYKSAGGTFAITSGNLTLDAMGDPNAVWIFQAPTSLTVGVAGPAGARSVNLINGAQARNVYWYVGTAATINGAGGGIMTGTIIASAGVTFSTAGNTVQTVLNGRALSLNASVTMVNTTINVP